MAQTALAGPPRSIRRAQLVRWLVGVLLATIVGMSAGRTIDALRARGMLGGQAQIGDTVALPSGSLRVDAAIPELMAAMQHEKFAQLGMSMSVMVPDSTPEGQQTITLIVTLDGGTRGMTIDLSEFTLAGDALPPTPALRSDMGGLSIPAGSAVNGTLVFRIPDDAANLTLRYGASQPIAITVDTSNHHDEVTP
jgi:hypothetical protein